MKKTPTEFISIDTIFEPGSASRKADHNQARFDAEARLLAWSEQQLRNADPFDCTAPPRSVQEIQTSRKIDFQKVEAAFRAAEPFDVSVLSVKISKGQQSV